MKRATSRPWKAFVKDTCRLNPSPGLYCAVPLLFMSACIAPRLQNSGMTSTTASGSARQEALKAIQNLIATSKDLGQGPGFCKATTFAFDESREGYEPDAFELHPLFRGRELKVTSDAERCTDTRERRPPLVLSSGIQGTASILPKDREGAWLQALGVGAPAARGEVIVANVFHLKRFWIARIPIASLKKQDIIFQLERFPVLPEPKLDATTQSKVLKFVQGAKANFTEWANENLAGHTQLRLDFQDDAVQLTEQVLRLDQDTPRVVRIDDLVLTSEAQGTSTQVYDPVKAIEPLFFSINRITSLEEKYTDMVVRQRHQVDQKKVTGTRAPKPETLLAFFLGMARGNWKAMAAAQEKDQDDAFYRTVDFRPPSRNLTRNCTTEVVTALEAGKKGGFLGFVQGRAQDLALQRLYPIFLSGALERSGFITGEGSVLPDMDRFAQDEAAGQFTLKEKDPTLTALRTRLQQDDLKVCEAFLKPEERPRCREWASLIAKNL